MCRTTWCCLWVEGGGGCHASYTLLCCRHCSHVRLVRSWGFMWLTCRRCCSLCALCSWLHLTFVSELVSEVFLSDRLGHRAEVWICVCTFLAQSDPMQRWSVWVKHAACSSIFQQMSVSDLLSSQHSGSSQTHNLVLYNTERTDCSKLMSDVWEHDGQSRFIRSYCRLTRRSWGSETTQLSFVHLSCLADSVSQRLDKQHGGRTNVDVWVTSLICRL